MLSGPADFWLRTFARQVVNSFIVNGFVSIGRRSDTLWLYNSSVMSTSMFSSLPSRLLKWLYHFFNLSSLVLPLMGDMGVLFLLVISRIVSQADAWRLSMCNFSMSLVWIQDILPFLSGRCSPGCLWLLEAFQVILL